MRIGVRQQPSTRGCWRICWGSLLVQFAYLFTSLHLLVIFSISNCQDCWHPTLKELWGSLLLKFVIIEVHLQANHQSRGENYVTNLLRFLHYLHCYVHRCANSCHSFCSFTQTMETFLHGSLPAFVVSFNTHNRAIKFQPQSHFWHRWLSPLSLFAQQMW